jgi:hypothetical protein
MNFYFLDSRKIESTTLVLVSSLTLPGCFTYKDRTIVISFPLRNHRIQRKTYHGLQQGRHSLPGGEKRLRIGAVCSPSESSYEALQKWKF